MKPLKPLKHLKLLLLVQSPSPLLSFQLPKLLPQLEQFRQLKPLDTINLLLPVQLLKPLKPRLKPPRNFQKSFHFWFQWLGQFWC